jgi:hypothetical protein
MGIHEAHAWMIDGRDLNVNREIGRLDRRGSAKSTAKKQKSRLA